MISQSFIQDLLCRVDIVDIVECDVRLRKAGANYSACCPFHSEKTPSFTVTPSKQFYHCFGCGAHGNAIDFLMEYKGMSFVDAISDLADRAGMQIPVSEPSSAGTWQGVSGTGFDGSGVPAGAKESAQDLIDTMHVAARFYQGQLRHSSNAVAYLKSRGLTGETAARFAVGYAPTGWQKLNEVFPDYGDKARGSVLIAAGLVIESDEGKRYDRFRDRIMFPILNLKGKIVGFGGRVLDEGEPKYLNSPETPLFQKGRELYNLFAARRAIREAGRVLVVEGYMDVLSLFQHGIDYAVATLGTATTPSHVQKLLRQTDNVVFCFDGDRAGRKAAWRALEDCLTELSDGKNISFLFLPDGEDPDSYIRNFGTEAFEQLIKQALPLSVFLFKELSGRVDMKTDEGRAQLIRDAKPLLARVAAPGFALMLLKRLAEISGATQGELEDILKLKRARPAPARPRAPRIQPASLYRRLIQILLFDPGYVDKLDRDLFTENGDLAEEEAGALRALLAFTDTHPNILSRMSAASVASYFHGSSHQALLQKAESETIDWDGDLDLEAEFSGILARLREAKRKRDMSRLHSKGLSSLTPEEKKELQRLALS
jgi:DNA primase